MHITYLKTFVTIVETGSLVRASEQIYVAQSTITARLKLLEDHIGQTLLNRDKSGISLTPAGNKLLPYARTLVGLWQQAKREAILPEGFEAVCTIGFHHNLWESLGLMLIDLIDEINPNMALTLHAGDHSILEQWLDEGVVDIILTYSAKINEGQSVTELPAEDIILYATDPNMPIIGSGQYIFVDHGEEFRRQHGSSYFAADTARISISSPIWAIKYMLHSGGIAYLSSDNAETYVTTGQLFEIKDAPLYQRKRYMVSKDNVTKNWQWFNAFLHAFLKRKLL